MRLWKVLPILLVSIHSTLAVWTLKKMSTAFIPANYINAGERQFTYDGGAANSVAFDPLSSYTYVAGKSHTFCSIERVLTIKRSM